MAKSMTPAGRAATRSLVRAVGDLMVAVEYAVDVGDEDLLLSLAAAANRLPGVCLAAAVRDDAADPTRAEKRNEARRVLMEAAQIVSGLVRIAEAQDDGSFRVSVEHHGSTTKMAVRLHDVAKRTLRVVRDAEAEEARSVARGDEPATKADLKAFYLSHARALQLHARQIHPSLGRVAEADIVKALSLKTISAKGVAARMVDAARDFGFPIERTRNASKLVSNAVDERGSPRAR